MRNTGIVRRLDELGRVVIPKEIRSVLRLREGEQIEIFMQNETLTLRKYSRLGEGFEEVEKLCQALKKSAKSQVFAMDSLRYIFSTVEGLVGEESSETILEVMEKRKAVCVEGASMSNSGRVTMPSLYIAPIVACGDLYGALMVGGEKIEEEQRKLCDFAVGFLVGCIENR